MAEPAPDTITIHVNAHRELDATGADLLVVIQGQNLVFGNAALDKAREVRSLVDDVLTTGLARDDLRIEGLNLDVEGGVIGKASSAEYRLRIRCDEIARLPAVIGAVATQKNARLDSMRWRYQDEEPARTELLRECLAKSRDRAEIVTRDLGVSLLGVRDYQEQVHDPESRVHAPALMDASRARKMAKPPVADVGMAMNHRKRIKLGVTVVYRVGPMG